jgi:hypothetical protein
MQWCSIFSLEIVSRLVPANNTENLKIAVSITTTNNLKMEEEQIPEKCINTSRARNEISRPQIASHLRSA